MRGQTNASNIGGNVGSDTKPIKIVNGVPVAVAYDLLSTSGNQNLNGSLSFSSVGNIGAYMDSSGGQILISAYNQNTRYRSRLIIAIQNDNTANLILQKFDNNDTYLGGTVIASL